VCSAHAWSNEYRKGVRTSLVSFYDWCVSNVIADANPAAGLPRWCAVTHRGLARPPTRFGSS
jgi:hypothetical protein